MSASKITPDILRRAYATVTRFAKRGGMNRDAHFDELEDLDGVAHEALVHAEATYDPSKASFATWSTFLVNKALRAYRTNSADRLVRVPYDQIRLARHVQYIRSKMTAANLEPPSNAQLAEAAGVTPQELSDVMAGYFVHHYPCDPSGEMLDLVDEDYDINRDLYIQELYSLTEAAVRVEVECGRIPHEAYEVFVRIYGYGRPCPLTQHEVASELGISQTEVSRLHTLVLTFLKEEFGDGNERQITATEHALTRRIRVAAE